VAIEEVLVKAQNPDELGTRIAKAQAGLFDDEDDIQRRARDGGDDGEEENEGPKRDGISGGRKPPK
jgi:hypothetical protein